MVSPADTTDELDINDAFNNISLLENNLVQEAYDEGLESGGAQGISDGYKTGYNIGYQIGRELGELYAYAVGQLQVPQKEKTIKSLEKLITQIEKFPRENFITLNIQEELDYIRMLGIKVKFLVRIGDMTRNTTNTTPSNSLAF